MAKDGWNPKQYEKFKNERSQPFFDLLDFLHPAESPRIIDLGCGTGELTRDLHRHFPSATTKGIDSSSEMLRKAKTFSEVNLDFELADIESWKAPGTFDVIFSNAALQWCSDHASLFLRLKESLKPEGQIAIQMPMNHDYPTHLLANEMSTEEPWASLLKSKKLHAMLKAEEYAQLLFNLGFKDQKVILRVYGHILADREGVLDWVQGTLLTPFKSRLSEVEYQEFLSVYRNRLFTLLPNEKPFFYPFKRILLWARI